eukprot:jgi/Mesvir1/23892/Mv10678-RA.2
MSANILPRSVISRPSQHCYTRFGTSTEGCLPARHKILPHGLWPLRNLPVALPRSRDNAGGGHRRLQGFGTTNRPIVHVQRLRAMENGGHPGSVGEALALARAAQERQDHRASAPGGYGHSFWGVIFRLLNIVRERDSIVLPGLLFAVVISVASSVAIPLASGQLFTLMMEAARETLVGAPLTPTSALLAFPKSIMFLGLLYAVLTFGAATQVTLAGLAAEELTLSLRTKVFAALFGRDISFFDSNRKGTMLASVQDDVIHIRDAMDGLLGPNGIRSLLEALVCGVVMFRLAPWLAVADLSVFAVLPQLTVFLANRARSLATQQHAKAADATALARELLHSITTIKAFAREDDAISRYNVRADGRLAVAMQASVVEGLLQGCTRLVMCLGAVAVCVVAGHLVASSAMSVGTWITFLQYNYFVASAMSQMSAIVSIVAKGVAAGDRVLRVMEGSTTTAREPPLDAAWREEAEEETALMALTHVPGTHHFGREPAPAPVPARLERHRAWSIRFEDVTFRYPLRPDTPALRGFNLSVPYGKEVAVVGRSGSGKSTLVSLLLRFYDVDEGAVLMDGVDVRSLDVAALRDHIGVVSEEMGLFSTSIAQNIAYGRPSASRAEIQAAATAACAHDFIMALPNGYDTMVGEGGVALAGGQRQRLGIARALLKQPRILILDEATSALDMEAERAVMAGVRAAMAGCTCIHIVHRLHTVKDFGRIVVIDKGQVSGS